MRHVIMLWLGLLLGGAAAEAKILEEVVQVPVRVVDRRGTAVEQPITVTIFRDEARATSPFLLLNHGRATNPHQRYELGRARFSDNARYFVGLGYAVFVPTRIGYGVTGGPDVEDSGACARRDFPPVYEAAAQQSLAVIDHAKGRSWVAPTGGLVVGQSFGGATAIALAAKNVPGVAAAINFAGGGGGDPTAHPENPCSEQEMARMFAGYGATARIPTLWLYSENDRYFGARKPRQWFDGFLAKGGQGRFVVLPASGEDGHSSFSRNPTAWRPEVERFLRGG